MTLIPILNLIIGYTYIVPNNINWSSIHGAITPITSNSPMSPTDKLDELGLDYNG